MIMMMVMMMNVLPGMQPEAVSISAGPMDDLEAEIARLDVTVRADERSCKVAGKQKIRYFFRNGEFQQFITEIGDDTVGIGFFSASDKHTSPEK